jgi:methylmalonyl-CoA epimerase
VKIQNLVAIDTHVHVESELTGNAADEAARKYFGNAGVSYKRQDLADYYRSVWELMAPQVASRPLALVRCPDGTAGECFFQKHASAGLDGKYLHTVIDSKRRQIIAVEDLDGMAAMLRDKLGIEVEYAEEIPGRATRLAMLPVGESYIELLQGLAPGSRTAQWVAENGQSLYHICFEVEDIDGALAELKAKGTPLLNETPVIGHGNCRIAFIDPKATGNILFELAEMPRDGAAGH